MIVRPPGAAEVIAAVNYARERDTPFAVRRGGHSVAGLATIEAGMVINETVTPPA